ncbi:MAG TPA: hypothetical protein VEY68_02825 [Anoxybacillus sp.]|nr:hypothetical protein [Anoxybacillus sp.]
MKKRLFLSLFLCLTLLLNGCYDDSKTNDIYLLPKDYEGAVYVFYNVKGAPKLQTEGEYNVIPVNEEGFYVTSTPDMDYGTVTDEYYYVNDNGKRKKINPHCVNVFGTGRFETAPVGHEKIDIRYTGFYVTADKSKCSEDFMTNGPSGDEDKLDELLYKIQKQYFGYDEYSVY